MTDNGENEVTEFDRTVADAMADRYDFEPDYEWSAEIRRGVQSAIMYSEVHGLSFANGTALVTLADNERYAIRKGYNTPVVAAAIAEARRLAWADVDGSTMLDALMAVNSAIHEEAMKPENVERTRRELGLDDD